MEADDLSLSDISSESFQNRSDKAGIKRAYTLREQTQYDIA